MNWAQLQSQFFTDHPPSREFFELHLGSFPWNEEVLPVYAWERHVYIAAVNPAAISEMMSTWPENWVLLQADAADLRALWQGWHPAETVAPESNPFDSEPRSMHFEDSTQPRIPIEMNEDTSPPVEMPRLPSDEFELPAASGKAFPPAMEATPPPSAPLPEIPEFNPAEFLETADAAPVAEINASEESLDLTGGFPDAEETPAAADGDEGLTPAVDESEMDGAPEGFEFASDVKPVAKVEVPDEFAGIENFSTTNTGASQVTISSLQRAPDDGAPAKIPQGVPKAKTPPIPASAPATAGMSKLDPPPAAVDRGRPPVAAAPKAPPHQDVKPASTPKTAPPPAAASAAVAAAPSPATPEAPVEASVTFHGLKVTAETKAMLAGLPPTFTAALLASKAGNSLRVIASSKPEFATPESERDFSLSTPSPFRIVTRTEKSYHGYLINSPYLDQFFQSWNKGNYPEHLTVAPVLSGANIMGFVIAFGSAQAAGKAGLQAVEALAENLVRNWPAAPANPKSKAG
ncbi:MAG: hypothetical protein KF767_11080 [Bdellovibrionaceae bacterium]|nr:hypothetical protein [Pseudobdellovibrionaceae bacterium]